MSSKTFLDLERRVCAYAEQTGIITLMQDGVILGLSGGMDSVLLLHLLSRMAAGQGFPLLAVHVHHHLRGEEADRDAEFCQTLCRALSVPFELVHCDVPAEMRKHHRGVEETARRMRYGALRALLKDRGFSCIATAHHASDQLETVLFQMLRGGGLSTLVGMRPVRLPLVRPFLCLTRSEIAEAVEAEGLSYVSDSTNADTAYARNYLRAEILPRMRTLNGNAEQAILRMSEGLSHDAALLEDLTDRALVDAPPCDGGMKVSYLLSLPEAIRRRIILRLFAAARTEDEADIPLEHVHLTKISQLLSSGRQRFSVAVPCALHAICEDGVFSFRKGRARALVSFPPVPLSEGETVLPEDITLSIRREDDTVFVRCFSFLHKIDIVTAFSSAIINGVMYCRGRLPGDSYRFHGHTRLLKKELIEKKVPQRLRGVLPVLCDDSGILWVPFLPVRENPPCD